MRSTTHRAVASVAILLIAVLAAAPQPGHAQAAPTAAVRRGRVVGVFDSQSGQPIEGAEIRDMVNGLSALTTSSGTLSLFFVDTSGSLIRIRKIGYQPIVMTASNSGRDTIPLTVALVRSDVVLPTVVSTARTTFTPRGPADTVRRLEIVGFYDRRVTTGAPSSSFVTGEKIEKLSTLNDLAVASGGRPICEGNVWIDGVKVTVPGRAIGPGRVSRRFKSGADDLVQTDEIAGIETYNEADMPAEYRAHQGNRPLTCATLIWTK